MKCEIAIFCIVNSHGQFAGPNRGAVLNQEMNSRPWRTSLRKALLDPTEILHATGLVLAAEEQGNSGAEQTSLLEMVDIWALCAARCGLACVIACSGCVVNTGCRSDESLSIGTAFLAGGAKHVVTTLWPVEELCALAVMSRFYEKLRSHECALSESNMAENNTADRTTIGAFLEEARQWYRSLNFEEHHALLKRLAPGRTIFQRHVPDNTDVCQWGAFSLFGPPEQLVFKLQHVSCTWLVFFVTAVVAQIYIYRKFERG
jgi:CHAT domain